MIGVKRSSTVRAVPDSVAVLCDIHGNAPALEAVLGELRTDPPEAVVIGGDVAAGPMPNEVLGALRALPWPVFYLRGNADRVVVMARAGEAPEYIRAHPLWESDRWTAARLAEDDIAFLDALPSLVRLEVGALGEVLFCHGTPRSDEERVTVFTPPERLEAVLAPAGHELVVCGHTHRQFDLAAGRFRMVNAGSVGRPYEPEPGAYWLRLRGQSPRSHDATGATVPSVALQRTEYDAEAATAAFAALGYPTAREMLAPVDADAIARSYEATADTPVDDASLT
jgi:predicted phosphodiesterase